MAAYTDADVVTALNAHYGFPADYVWPYPTPSHASIRAALDAVAPAIAARAKAEALREHANRLFRADIELSRMKHQTESVVGKAEGVRLAQSYAEEFLRDLERT